MGIDPTQGLKAAQNTPYVDPNSLNFANAKLGKFEEHTKGGVRRVAFNLELGGNSYRINVNESAAEKGLLMVANVKDGTIDKSSARALAVPELQSLADHVRAARSEALNDKSSPEQFVWNAIENGAIHRLSWKLAGRGNNLTNPTANSYPRAEDAVRMKGEGLVDLVQDKGGTYAKKVPHEKDSFSDNVKVTAAFEYENHVLTAFELSNGVKTSFMLKEGLWPQRSLDEYGSDHHVNPRMITPKQAKEALASLKAKREAQKGMPADENLTDLDRAITILEKTASMGFLERTAVQARTIPDLFRRFGVGKM
jgi:hypothetical protein